MRMGWVIGAGNPACQGKEQPAGKHGKTLLTRGYEASEQGPHSPPGSPAVSIAP